MPIEAVAVGIPTSSGVSTSAQAAPLDAGASQAEPLTFKPAGSVDFRPVGSEGGAYNWAGPLARLSADFRGIRSLDSLKMVADGSSPMDAMMKSLQYQAQVGKTLIDMQVTIQLMTSTAKVATQLVQQSGG